MCTLEAKNSLALGVAVKSGGDNELGGNINGRAQCSIFGRWTMDRLDAERSADGNASA